MSLDLTPGVTVSDGILFVFWKVHSNDLGEVRLKRQGIK